MKKQVHHTGRLNRSGLTVSRRRFLQTSGAIIGFTSGFTGANFLVPRTAIGQDKMTNELNLYTWGGSFADAVRQAIVEPFQKETGVRVTIGVTGNPAQMLALLKAGSLGGASTIDILWEDLAFSYSAIKQDLVEPLRLENIPSYQKLYPLFNKLQKPVPWDPGKDVHGAPAEYVARGVGYNTKLIKRELTSVRELWNSEFKGRVGIYNNVQWMMVNACFYTGQDTSKIQDLGKIWTALKEQHKLVNRYFDNWAEGMELMQNETIWLSPFVGGRAVQLEQKGFPMRFVMPGDGWTLNADLLLIGKGSKNRYTAEKFIEFSYRPDIATRTAELGANPIASFNMQSTEAVKKLPGYDSTGELRGVSIPDPGYWDANMSEWTEKVREIQAG
jgi:spermidine/putrescine transport system substrate-binding protein